MDKLTEIILSLEKGIWFTAFSIKGAYFHINIHLAHRHFLRFTVSIHHFQYRALPFGKSTTPRDFTIVFYVIAAYIRCYGVLVFPYLDDWLLTTSSRQEAPTSISMLLNLLSFFGVSINIEKSIQESMQSLDFIWATVSSITA